MAHFIRKERLGSNPPPDKFRVGRGELRGGVKFGVMGVALEKAKADQKAQMDETYESNAEVQRWRGQMTPEERTRDAIERMVPTTKVVQEMREGREVTHEEARKVAENLANKSDRQKSGE